MIKSVRAIIKKSTLYTAAFVLAVSSFAVAMPYFMNRQVNAIAALSDTSAQVATNITKSISYDDVQKALDEAVLGDTVRLDADVTLPSTSLQLLNSGVTLNGNNKTVRPEFMGVNNTKNSAAVYVGASNVTISNLTVVGPSNRESSMHNIQVYAATGVALDNVTVKNATKSGLLVNSSKVTVTNLATENNAWAAVNVDNAGAHLTVLGTVTHIEPVTAYAHIFVDNRAELDAGDVKVTYSGQYVRFWEANGYAYFVDTEKPTVATTINNAYNPTEITVTAHDDQRLNRIDVSLRKDNGAVVTKWWGENIAYIHKNDRTLDLSQSIASLNLPDGSYTVRATVSDILGKTVNAVNQSFIVDHKKPSVSVDMSDRLIGLNDATPTLRIDANDANGVNRVQYKIVRAEDQSKTVAGWFTIVNGVDTEISAVSSLGDGDYILVARAYDNAENKRSGAEVAFTIDRIAPAATISDYTAEENAITPNVTSNDSSATYAWVLTSGDPAGLAPFDNDVLAPTFTALLDGTYEFKLTTTDAAGNSSVTLFSFTYAAPVPVVPAEPAEVGGTPAAAQSTVGGFSNVIADSTPVPAVLGAQTETPEASTEGTHEVKGAATETVAQAVDTDREESSIGGLAWYWWLIIAAVALGLVWWIAAAARRRNSEA